MATEEEVRDEGHALGPQTAAARRRARPRPDVGVDPPAEEPPSPTVPVANELSEIEEADEPAVMTGPAPPELEPDFAAEPDFDELDLYVPPSPPPAPPGFLEPRPRPRRTLRLPALPALPTLPRPRLPRLSLLRTETAPPAPPRPRAPERRPEPAGPPPGAAVAALATLGSALVMLLVVLSSLGSDEGTSLAEAGSIEAKPSLREVAPGGRIELTGSGAPAGAPMVLETRSAGDEWQQVGSAAAGEEGGFRVSGRVAAAPGTVQVRARAENGTAASTPAAVAVRPLRLASVGDINLGDVPGAGIAAEGPRFPWVSAGRPLRDADIAFGNLECAISTRGEPFEKLYNFRGTPGALRGLARHSGLDVLNLANNHAGDYGPVALLDTVRGIERLGMEAVGAGPNLRRALQPQVVERLGLKVAFVGFSEILPIEFAAAPGRPGTAWATPEAVTRAVHAARRRADVVVATFHWGIEKAATESAAQQALAAAAAAAGAQLVIGAHPHVLQPIRRQGAALVAYSLGNFVFGAVSADTTATGILETDLTSEGVAGARWRGGTISSGRPELERSRPQPLPVDDPDAMAVGITL